MKLLSLCLVLLAAFSACHEGPKQTASKPAAIAADVAAPKNYLKGYPNADPVVKAYTQFLRTLDTTDLATSQTAVNKFRQLFTGQQSEVCDTGFMLFWKYQNSLDMYDEEDSGVQKLIGPVRLDTLAAVEARAEKPDAKEQKALQRLRDNNFIIVIEQRKAVLLPGWQLVSRHFLDYVSAPMKEAMTEETREEKEGFQNDAGLMIGPSELIARAMWWDRFLARYPHHIYHGLAKHNYNVLVYVMISGTNVDPVTSFDGKYTLHPFYDSVYHIIQDSFPDSHTNTLIKPFWQAVLARDVPTMNRIHDSVPLDMPN